MALCEGNCQLPMDFPKKKAGEVEIWIYIENAENINYSRQQETSTKYF